MQNATSQTPSSILAASGYPYARLHLTAFDRLERTPSETATRAARCGHNARQGV